MKRLGDLPLGVCAGVAGEVASPIGRVINVGSFGMSHWTERVASELEQNSRRLQRLENALVGRDDIDESQRVLLKRQALAMRELIGILSERLSAADCGSLVTLPASSTIAEAVETLVRCGTVLELAGQRYASAKHDSHLAELALAAVLEVDGQWAVSVDGKRYLVRRRDDTVSVSEAS